MMRMTVEKYEDILRKHAQWLPAENAFYSKRMLIMALVEQYGDQEKVQDVLYRLRAPKEITMYKRVARLTGYDYEYLYLCDTGFHTPRLIYWFISRFSKPTRQGYNDGKAILDADIWDF